MSAAISEISSSAATAAGIAATAVGEVATARSTMEKLDESSSEIGNVVTVITQIAEQTNLLALHATIEAARAGASGQAFAVAASRVKDLATQTSTAPPPPAESDPD